MPPARTTTALHKKRVRTGCLTCRKRRRKCDEAKPRCENCQAKGFSCKYASDVTFVSASKPEAQQHDSLPGGIGGQYRTITFVVDGGPIVSKPPENNAGILHEHTISQAIEDGNTIGVQPIVTNGFTAEPAVVNDSNSAASTSPSFNRRVYHARNYPWPKDILEKSAQHSISGFLTDSRGRLPNSDNRNIAGSQSYSDSTFSGQVTSKTSSVTSTQEIDLLRYFRYSISPRIDVGDPDSSFGIKVMLLAKTNKSLFAAILALSAGQKLLTCQEQESGDIERSLGYRVEAEHDLTFEGDPVRLIGKALLTLGDFFSSSPRQWRSILLCQTDILGSVEFSTTPEKELREALFWFYLRMDLAASIISAKLMFIPSSSYLCNNGVLSGSFPLVSHEKSVKQVHQHSLCLLSSCISLIFGDHSLSTSATTELAISNSAGNSNFSSLWTSVWTDCQKWYDERPVELQHILYVRSDEADQIDAQNASSFPILIYTTPLALLSNAVYHITSLLLLTHRPRLLKPLSGPRSLTSHIWHAQSIAGIAASNDYLEQWDPILVAGLFLISEQMTHETQQSVLLEQFGRVTTMTGLKLDDEREALKYRWKMSRADEEAID